MKNYIVIKYYERFLLTVPGVPDAWPQWAVVTAGTIKENRVPVKAVKMKNIDKQEAMRLIRDGGLVCVEQWESGKVFDTPERDFQRTHKGIRVPLGIV